MPAPKPRPDVTPRGWTAAQVAGRLGVSVSWFHDNRADLHKANFPQCDGLTGRWDSKAIEIWMDKRSGIAANDDLGFDPFLEGVRAHGHV
jgi:predicted DNA-binding transcriptional regulator AlpA